MGQRWEQAPRHVATIRRGPSLTEERELELARCWKLRRDRRAADLLARATFPYVRAQALRYGARGSLLHDLIAEGNLGIVLALDKFDPDRGVRFSAYATYWIRARMTNCLLAGRGISPRRYFELSQQRRRVMNEFGAGEVADRILAQRLEITVDRLNERLARLDMRWLSYDVATLDQAISATGDFSTPSDQEERLGELQYRSRLQRRVRAALGALDARERHIVERRLMADPEDQPSLAELARHFNVSRERVGQLEARAKRKLRSHIAGASARAAGTPQRSRIADSVARHRGSK